MSKFDQFLKDSVSNYPVEYNADSWKSIEQKLNADLRKKRIRNTSIAISVAAIAVVGLVVLQPNEQPAQNKEQTTVEKTQVPSSKEEIQDTSTNTQSTSDSELADQSRGENKTTEQEDISKTTLPENIDNPREEITSVIPEEKIEKSVEFEKGIQMSLQADRKNICAGDWVNFNASLNTPATYRWTFGDGTESDLPSPRHTYSKAGEYVVSLEVTSLLDGKSKRVLFDNNIVVNESSSASFDFNVLQPEDFEQKVSFTNNSNNSLSTEWIINGKTHIGNDVEEVFNAKGNYPITLITKNEFGCYDTLNKHIQIDENYNLLAPTAFTPNNDGQNDIFLPKALENTQAKYMLTIINTSNGQVVYRSSTEGWDGINTNTGNRAVTGAYAWTVVVTLQNNQTKTFNGIIQVLE